MRHRDTLLQLAANAAHALGQATAHLTYIPARPGDEAARLGMADAEIGDALLAVKQMSAILGQQVNA